MAREYYCVFPRKLRTGNSDDALDSDLFHSNKEPISGDVGLVFEDDSTWVYEYNSTSYSTHDGHLVIRSNAVAEVNPGRWLLRSSFPNMFDLVLDGGPFAETELTNEWLVIKASTSIDGGGFTGARTSYVIDAGNF